MNKAQNTKIVTRFAPSPTGPFHLGAARTALFNFVVARQSKGTFIVRMEDTDSARSKKVYEDDIVEGLRWLGLACDVIYRQSERKEIYTKHIAMLLKSGAAYESEEERKSPESKTNENESGTNVVIRFRNPNKTVTFIDELRGEITFDTTELGDFVIARSPQEPLYHLAVVIDDYEMQVTHVIRGEDHISNTPRQILIQEALGALRPSYAHIPLVLAPDRSKLSKRHGALSVNEYKEQGYLPDAVVNFLALLGWSPQSVIGHRSSVIEEEIFTLENFIERFSLKQVQKSGAVFNIQKLNWINKEHTKKLSEKDLEKNILAFLPAEVKRLPQWSGERFMRLVPVITERIETFGALEKMHQEGELGYFFAVPEYETARLPWKETSKDKTKQYIDTTINMLQSVPPETFTGESVKKALWDYAEEKGRGNVLWPMRYALSGRDKSPDPFTLAEVLGKDETLKRLKKASDLLGK